LNLNVWWVYAAIFVVVLTVLIVRERKKGAGTGSAGGGKKGPGRVGTKHGHKALQAFLPIDGFDKDGSMRVQGQIRRLIKVDDLNLYALSTDEIRTRRDQFAGWLKRLQQPCQLSIQARRANYHDYVDYARESVEEAVNAYKDERFSRFATGLLEYLREEAARPRTDRENIIVIGTAPRIGAETETSQMERLEREQVMVEQGLRAMGLPYRVLDPVATVEAVQNMWSRERAVSQRYRDLLAQKVLSPNVGAVPWQEETEVGRHA